jgi:hypothetical protein
MLPTKFRFIWQSGFTGEDFLEINQSETRMGGSGLIRRGLLYNIFFIICGLNCISVYVLFVSAGKDVVWFDKYEGHHFRCFLPSFGSFGKAVSQEKIF